MKEATFLVKIRVFDGELPPREVDVQLAVEQGVGYFDGVDEIEVERL